MRGLTDTGYLAADDDDASSGARYELHPDGNSLDFFAGLIARKRAAPSI